MIDKFGKILLSMVALLFFQAYLYVSEPPSSDLYFIFVTIIGSLIALIISLYLNNNLLYTRYKMNFFIKSKIWKSKDKNSKITYDYSQTEESYHSKLDYISDTREYSALSISLSYFIAVNLIFALIYM